MTGDQKGAYRTCDNEAYWSASADEDGEIMVTVECDAYPSPDCGFRAEFGLPWGATGTTVKALTQAHADGRKDVVPILAVLARCEQASDNEGRGAHG